MPRRRQLSALVGSAWLALAGCAAPPPPLRGDAPEPAEALRPAEARGEVPEAARIADYVIDARLDAERHLITGTARITWRNRTRIPVRTLPFHLYMNAFRSEDTAWMREARGTHRGERQEEEGAWGYIDLSRVVALGPPQAGGLQTGELRPGEPTPLPWAEGADPSTMTVDLPFAVGPGEALTVEIDFKTQLPRVFARTGYSKDFHMVGQWYPKIGVLDPERGWQNHVFTYNSEFYADFGDYEVTLDVPAEMIVGATGILVGEGPGSNGDGDGDGPPVEARKTLRYRAEMVHDFAWAAAPDFVEVRSAWRGVRIRQLLAPEFAADADAHEAALVATLESMDTRFGPYPWSTITVIHPPERAGGAAGMEYPTLFTSSPMAGRSLWLRALDLEERGSGLFTTIHEFGHQYFQGLLASDESAEPWLDEGMNTFANALTLLDWGDEGPWVARLGPQTIVEPDLIRLSLLFYSDLDPVRSPAEGYLALARSYGTTVYRKTAAAMMTARHLAGADDFDAALRDYALTWRFRHPTGDDLLEHLIGRLGPARALPAVGGQAPVLWDLRDYFTQVMTTTDVVDFGIELATTRRRSQHAGWRRDEHGALVGGERPEGLDRPLRELDDDDVEAVVMVRRRGGVRIPVILEVEFKDGSRDRVRWDGQGRYHVFTWPGRRLRRAELDPDGELLLEGRRLDNAAAADVAADDRLAPAIARTSEALTLALMGGMAL